MGFLGLREKKWGGRRYIRHWRSFDYKPEARKRARELRKEGKLVRTVKEEGKWWVYSRQK